VRRAALAAAALLAVGCGGSAGDLLALEVAGGPRGGTDRLVVTDDGRARCDGGELEAIGSAELIEAREIARELTGLANEGRSFPAASERGRRHYVARVREGTVRWTEAAPGRPEVLPRAELYALRLGRVLCR
jgi:hypothetical protein